MGNLGQIFANNLFDYTFKTANSTNWAQPGSVWVGLCTGSPTATATNEVTAGGYARKQIAFTTGSAGAGTAPTTTCNFDQATTTWGTLSGYIICAASTGSTGTSTYIFGGAVSPTVAVLANDTVSFASAAITFTYS